MSTRADEVSASRYRIVESVGPRLQRVRSYEDLEIHHPSWQGREPGRVYATVDGEREEVLRRRAADDNMLVSKDLILIDDRTGSSEVRVPAPSAGVIGRVDAVHGVVTILDRAGGTLIAQLRHMDLRETDLAAGQPVMYGQPLGIQSGFGGGNPRRYGIHVHIDFNIAYLDQFKRYIADLDAGTLTIPASRHATRHVSDDTAHVAPTPKSLTGATEVQSMLRDLGYRAPSGAALAVDGHIGPDTAAALRDFAIDAGLGPIARRGTAVQTLRDTHRTRGQARDSAPAVLETGDRGAAVEQLQRALNRVTPGATLLAEDGEFGPRTRQAVEAFQRAHGLHVDGRAGPATAEAIELAQRSLPSHAAHPGHARFQEALDAVHAMEQRACRPSGAHSERLAAAVALAALDQGLARVDRVELNDRGTLARGIEVSTVRDESTLNRTTSPISTEEALRMPLHEAGLRLDAAVPQHVPSSGPAFGPTAPTAEPARPLLR